MLNLFQSEFEDGRHEDIALLTDVSAALGLIGCNTYRTEIPLILPTPVNHGNKTGITGGRPGGGRTGLCSGHLRAR